jgi:hypothetical protein
MSEIDPRAAFNAELARTAYQKKAVSKLPPSDVLDFAEQFFRERGYRAARTGRPNHVFVMGGREGILPRVTGEIAARQGVGRTGSTLVTLDAAGENLGKAMEEFREALRKQRVSPVTTE